MFSNNGVITFIEAVSVLGACCAIGIYRSRNRTLVGTCPKRIFHWWSGIGWVASGIVWTLHGYKPYGDVIFASLEFYLWWNHGGNDGFKNFIRKLMPKPAYVMQ